MTFRSKIGIAALIVFAILCCVAFVAFRGTGRWLVRQDPLAKADEIVVLSGTMPARAEEAGRIFQMGYAPQVWVSTPDSPREELAAMGIPFSGEEDYSRAVLIQEGVPADAVKIFPQPIVDTENEIEEISAQMRRDGKTSAIVVTSPQHTRRVRVLWSKLAGGNLRLIVREAPQDAFDADHWWRNTRDTFSVVRELLGILNAWLGLPVRPHS
ncbi:MAG TPA: YdcF family protein [Candidatus Acidoferrales bacterium]|nr:YdcF family protein [Candidatus Acidoferrales bacterium]